MLDFIKILIMTPSLLLADDCLDWFKDLNIKQGVNCLSECLIAPVGMGTFTCTKRCKEFCKKSVPVKTPDRQEVINYITVQCKKKNMPERIGLAVAWLENRMEQFDGDAPAGNENRDEDGNLLSTDWGIMQINDKAWKSAYDINKLKNDWKYNIDAGIDIAAKSYSAAFRKDKNGQNEGDKGSGSSDENFARATYSGYNAGTANISRYRIKKDKRDSNFITIYREMPWKDGGRGNDNEN